MGLLQPHVGHRRGDGEAAVTHVVVSRIATHAPALLREAGTFNTATCPAWVPVLQRTASTRHRARDIRDPMTKSFRTLDDVDVKGKRVLLRVDLNVPMENGRVSDATRLERVAPTITEISGKGGKVDPARAFRPAQGTRCQGLAEAGRRSARESDQETGRVRRGLRRRAGGQGDRGDEGWRHPLPGKYPLPQGRRKERSGLRRGTGKARRHLGQRRLLGRAPRARLDRRPRPQAAGLCRTHHAGRT